MRVCVYGASADKIDRDYIEAGEQLGRIFAGRGWSIVYGGGSTGLMGAVARGMTAGGGEITGVAPVFFQVDGVLYEHCKEMLRPETMRQRKQIMEDLADAFVITPGGLGTMDEFFEILTLRQLGRHAKPICILNTNGYYDDLLAMMDYMQEKGFVEALAIDCVTVTDDPEQVPALLEEHLGDKPIFAKATKQAEEKEEDEEDEE